MVIFWNGRYNSMFMWEESSGEWLINDRGEGKNCWFGVFE